MDIRHYFKTPKILDDNKKNEIKKLFLVDMPYDFFDLWKFCYSLNSIDPKNALQNIGLILVGPYDVLDGTLNESSTEKQSSLCHYRYYYDPPELLTVLKQSGSNYHIGYFRDDPKEMPSFLAFNDPDKSCIISSIGDNIFTAVINYCDKMIKPNDKEKSKYANEIRSKMTSFMQENGIITAYESSAERKKKILSKLFHGSGLVVPVKNDVGYRSMSVTDLELKKILEGIIKAEENQRESSTHFKKLKEVITLSTIASDECDFGTNLELGLNLFSFGDPFFHKYVNFLLSSAYDLLGRSEYSTIIQVHLKNRRKGPDLKF